MTAALADLRELPCSLSTFAAFQGHCLSAFAAFNSSSKKITLVTCVEPTSRNFARLSRSRVRCLATNLKLSLLLPFFCQRPTPLFQYQNLSPSRQQRCSNRGFRKTMP